MIEYGNDIELIWYALWKGLQSRRHIPVTKKKYPGTKHWKAINFFLPSGKGRERKNEVKLVINKS